MNEAKKMSDKFNFDQFTQAFESIKQKSMGYRKQEARFNSGKRRKKDLEQ